MGAIIFRWVSISALVVVLVWALIAASDGTESKLMVKVDCSSEAWNALRASAKSAAVVITPP